MGPITHQELKIGVTGNEKENSPGRGGIQSEFLK
jgi:hypothetical protein